MNEIVAQSDARAVPDFYQPSAIMDPARFQHLSVVARVMADSSFMPDTLRGKTREETYANAFLVVNISDRWGIDPFLAAQCMSVVYGKIMVEGKLISAVLDKMLGVQLDYDHIRDDKGIITGIRVSGPRRGSGKVVSIEGTIEGWATRDRNGAILKQWTLPQAETQLIYRGTREWVRVYEPGILLGVITDDEFDPDFGGMRNITPRDNVSQTKGSDIINRLNAAKSTTAQPGFDHERVQQATQSAGKSGDAEGAVSNSSSDGGEVKASPSDIQKPDERTSSPASSGEPSGSGAGGSSEVDSAKPAAESTSSDPTEEHWAWLQNVAKFLWAATNFNGDLEILINQRKATGEEYPAPKDTPKIIIEKATSVFKNCEQVCNGSIEPDDAAAVIAGIARLDAKDLPKKVATK